MVQLAFRRAKNRPILIVGETENFATKEVGGIVNFFVQDTSIKFEINPKSLNAVGLKANSKLLQLGVVIND